MSKDIILQTVDALPDEVELDTLLERLVFVAKVEEGLRQSEAGQTVAHDDVKKIIKTWSK